MKRLIRFVVVAAVALGWEAAAVPVGQAHESATAPSSSGSSCQLGNGIQHVVNVVFDNVHLSRTDPNVPSDLEQMPSLLNFIEQNGTMVTHNYTPLISHTADDIVTTLTGLYPDQQGLAVANSYGFFRPNGTVGFTSAFQYWTDKISNGTYNNLTAAGMNTPAPWVPFTRAGCNVGGVSTANIELENNGNITQVFGANSPEANELAANPTQATADFIGIAIHCAQNSAVCSTANNGRPDVLPQEPGGYNGFLGLFGHKYVAPAISPSGSLTDLDGNAMTGFPGFGGISASQSLGYTAAMLEHGVPVTYSYISDAHDNHASSNAQAFGPGEAGYEAQLRSYDSAFAKFFARLAADGITPQNTLFNFSSDENDHFAGGAGSPAGCDGVTVACTYVESGPNETIGEIDSNLADLMAKAGVTTPFAIHVDDAPSVHLIGNPARDAAVTRTFEQAAATLVDPKNQYSGQSTALMQRMADSVEMQVLHMVTGDPSRTPTFIFFGNPDYFFVTGGPDFAPSSAFAWNHGSFNPDIVTSWLGLVGPGVLRKGVDDSTWTSHVDTRPTIMALTGLTDDYVSEGRVILEDLNPQAVPSSLKLHRGVIVQLGQVYSQLDAPVGQLGLDTLRLSTMALASKSSGDATYASLESKIASFGSRRDALAAQIIAVLDAAEFDGKAIDVQQAHSLISDGQGLLAEVHSAAA